jgi:sugar-specific transcriptional regulator TrmB
LGEETIRNVLKNSGLTERETEVYIFLAKHDPLKTTEVAKLLGKDKAQLFRILQKLKAKGYVEETLEFPARYAAVSFESVLESIINAKREEVVFIEKSRNDLLEYLKKKRQTESSLEKFVVIKGYKRIYSKITKMVQNTQHQLSVVTTVQNLLQADRFGVFDAAVNNPLRSQVEYRFLTELSKQNFAATREVLSKMVPADFSFKARNPEFGIKLFPRMIIRYGKEILFFTNTERAGNISQDDACLWTNCKSLVQAFMAVFEDLWRNSTDLQEKITEIQKGQLTTKTTMPKDVEAIKKKYEETIRCAAEEIILITPSKRLNGLYQEGELLEEWSKKGVCVKVMTPIVQENLETAERLSKMCTIKHSPIEDINVALVDGKYFFQFKTPTLDRECPDPTGLEDIVYATDFGYVRKMKNVLDDLWENGRVPSSETIDDILRRSREFELPPSDNRSFPRHFEKIIGRSYLDEHKQSGELMEKKILNEIITAQKEPAANPSESAMKLYGSTAGAVIHPPDHFKLSDMVIHVYHIEKHSSLGEEDAMFVFLWLETPIGHAYLPVAIVGDNPESQPVWKTLHAGTPAGQNVRLLEKEAFQIRIHGNTLFAGWTVPIPLFPRQYSLPPACLLVEGFGKLITKSYTSIGPAGYRSVVKSNGFPAFVTFFHPASKYSGPGTEGFFARDVVSTTYSPSNRKEKKLN